MVAPLLGGQPGLLSATCVFAARGFAGLSLSCLVVVRQQEGREGASFVCASHGFAELNTSCLGIGRPEYASCIPCMWRQFQGVISSHPDVPSTVGVTHQLTPHILGAV